MFAPPLGPAKPYICPFLVHAVKEIILAGGAFNSPQLLLLSGIGPRAALESVGISPKLELPGVGQNLGDHPRVHIIAVLSNSSETSEKITPDMFDTALINWCQLPGVFDSHEFKALAPEIQKFIATPHNPTCEIYMVCLPPQILAFALESTV